MKTPEEIVQDLIRFPSLTPVHDDPGIQRARFNDCNACLDYVQSVVDTASTTTERITFSGGHAKWSYPVPNLYSELIIGNPAAQNHKSLCYLGHIDVVPVGDETLWTHPPFSGDIRDGFIHGRGATDMKGSVGGWLWAISKYRQNCDANTNLTLSMILTADEEYAGINGTNKVLNWMKINGKTLDAFIVGEPSSPDILGTHIKIGRRGSLGGFITANGVQGHRAYDSLFKNPNRALSCAMTILNMKKWKDGSTIFPNTTLEFTSIESGDFNTTAIIPETARARWNIRYTNHQSKGKLFSELKNIIQNPPAFLKNLPDYEEAQKIIVTANLDTASEPYYSEPAALAQSTRRAVHDVLGLIPQFNGEGGTTDGRFVHNHFPNAQIIELGVPEAGGLQNGRKPIDYHKRGGMHQVDERVSVRDVKNLAHIYAGTIMHYTKE